jgi:hypothetical protein
MRVIPKPQSTIPVRMVASASVIRTGASSGADGLAATTRSTIDEARMPVMAAVELSGPEMAKGSELPAAITPARMADEMNVAATP